MIFIAACTVTEKSQRKIKYSFQAGVNQGGITENTDMAVVPNVTPKTQTGVDAFSGATKTGFNAGFHINKPLKYNELEVGIDYMYNDQTFTYSDPENTFSGTRQFIVNQIMVPVTYNFNILKSTLPRSEFQLKVGYVNQLNFISVSEKGNLPDYSLKRWSGGVTAGISIYPYTFKNGSKIGFFIDGYRGSRIYTDFYNQDNFEMPASSYMKGGLRFRFK